MKIAILNNLYFPHERGGAEKIAKNIAAELTSLGHEVFTVSTAPKTYRDQHNYYLSSNYSRLNKKNALYRLFWQAHNLYNHRKYQELKKIFKEIKPDLVITNNLMGLGLLTPRLIADLGIRHIHILHDLQLLHPAGIILAGQEKKLNSYWAKKYQTQTRKLMDSPKLVISPSKWLMDLHRKRGFFPDSNIEIRNNPVTINTKIEIDREPKQFLCIAQAEVSKGVPFLVSVWKKLPNDLKLKIIGDGSLLEKLKRETNTDQIEFLGRQGEERFALLAQSAALIVPSLTYENSPNVIIEAASQGKPSIASHIGGIPELIEKYGGLTFAPNNETDFIEKLNLFLSQPEKVKVKTIPPTDNYAAWLLKQV